LKLNSKNRIVKKKKFYRIDSSGCWASQYLHICETEWHNIIQRIDLWNLSLLSALKSRNSYPIWKKGGGSLKWIKKFGFYCNGNVRLWIPVTHNWFGAKKKLCKNFIYISSKCFNIVTELWWQLIFVWQLSFCISFFVFFNAF